ncbi:MAG: hypothetical protein DRH26_05365 [Deltaproteobacteria bacterium]|nr:MAG: hypothetical protein DRH26_05365 [Deltaproteobacteria bacterium]
MDIKQITSGNGSTDDQIGVTIGKKYIHIYRMDRNCDWKRSTEKVCISEKLKEMVEWPSIKTQDFKNELFHEKFMADM